MAFYCSISKDYLKILTEQGGNIIFALILKMPIKAYSFARKLTDKFGKLIFYGSVKEGAGKLIGVFIFSK